jgi:ATP-dependent Clp protease ATP-binding subunit ClpX
MNSIKEMKVAIKQLEDFYIELSLKLDEMYDAKYSEKANDFLYELIDTYDSLLQYDDIEKIKEGIVKIQEKSRKNIVRIAESYKDESIYKIHEIEEEPEIEEEISKINVREMKKYFDQVIIGQEEAKKDVISAIVMNKLTEDKYNKNACLLVGPTGSGKTLIAESVSKYFDMPMEIIDTTQITMPGYVGANIEDFLVRLVTKTNGDIKKAEEGIVVFDELDKKGTENNSDVSGKGVLNTLLPFLQGTTYNLNYGGRTILFDTSKLTIFATGAFTDVAKAKKEDKGSNVYSNTNIGFNAKLDDSESLEDIKYEKLEVEDFVKYGNMPIELIGRFSTIAQLSGHTKESLRKILTESLTSPLLAEQSKLQKLNINLTWDDEYLDEVVNEALKLKTGARSLKNIVERTIKVARWEVLLNNDKYQEIHLIKDTIFDSYNCILVDNLGNNWVLRDRLSNEDDMKLVRKK